MATTISYDGGVSDGRLPRSVPAPIRNPLRLALFWASKTDSRLVSVCSGWAMSTQAAFGVFVLFTATLAFGAAYYTLSTLNAPDSVVPWIALGWSVFIFFLDREIAGSLDKTTAVVRPFLALFIGTLVAIPIELWVFQQRIDQELQRQYRQDNKRELDQLRTKFTELDQRRADLQRTSADLQKQEADWAKVLDAEAVGRPGPGRTGLRGAGPVFQNAQVQQNSVRQRMQEIRNDLDRMDAFMPEERRRLEGQFQREEVAKIRDFVTRFEALDKVVHSSDALYRLSWLITLALILVEMTPAILKFLTQHVDYHHLVKAEIRENRTRIDELSDRNYRLAMENPEAPELSVSEKFAIARYAVDPHRMDSQAPGVVVPINRFQPSVPGATPEFGLSYLDQLCDSLLPAFGDMPHPTVLIKPVTDFDNANAHCISSSSLFEPSTIEFNEEYLRRASEEAVENTMKHELIHAWIHFKGITDSELHGHVFIKKGKEVGCDVERYELELAEKRVRASEKAAADDWQTHRGEEPQ